MFVYLLSNQARPLSRCSSRSWSVGLASGSVLAWIGILTVEFGTAFDIAAAASCFAVLISELMSLRST